MLLICNASDFPEFSNIYLKGLDLIDLELNVNLEKVYFRSHPFIKCSCIYVESVHVCRIAEICDAIWKNPPHVAQGNFAEYSLNCYVFLYFLSTLIMHNFGCTYHRDKIYITSFKNRRLKSFKWYLKLKMLIFHHVSGFPSHHIYKRTIHVHCWVVHCISSLSD